jgi:hypothetical protein
VTVPHLVRLTMSNYRAFLKEKQKDNQPIVIVNGGLDFLLSYGRPIGENFAEVKLFQKLDNKTIFAKTIFDSKERRVKELFYSITKSGECNLEELKGISMLTYEDREDSFQAIEYDPNQNIKATYYIQPHKDGWSVNLLYPQENKNPVFTQQIYDYNGKIIKINSTNSEESKKDPN